MSQFDLREWLRAAGELQHISGADAVLEIGAASELNYRRSHPRALLFGEIAGYRPGRRVLTSSLSNPALMGLTLGLGPGLSDHDLVEALRGRPAGWAKAAASYPAEPVDSGPVFENVVVKGEIDFLAFPSPLWHEKDGGRYIGTGCAVVTTDPGTGVPNVGAYRIQVQDDGASVSINMEAGRHGAQHVRAWFAREGRAPVAVSLGHHPVFLMVSGTEVPLGLSELDYAGAILGERVPVVRCPDTGLSLPAESELAFEGWLYPDRTRPEGPFGEWTGYYSGGVKPVLTAEVTGLFHRNDPVNLGAPPGKPPFDYSYMRSVMKSAMATDALASAGLPRLVVGMSGSSAPQLGAAFLRAARSQGGWRRISCCRPVPGAASSWSCAPTRPRSRSWPTWSTTRRTSVRPSPPARSPPRGWSSSPARCGRWPRWPPGTPTTCWRGPRTSR